MARVRREPTTSTTLVFPPRRYWVQVRRVGGDESAWMKLGEPIDDYADALIACAEKKQTSQPQWEFRVA